MRSVVLEEPGRLAAAERPEPPAPGPGQALVRVRRVGVCGTDLHAYQGNQPFFTYPRVVGHELGVEVVAVGSGVTRVAPGDRCAVEPYFNCGSCVACRRGRSNCCTALQVLGVHTDGGMQECLVVPADKLHPSARLSLDQLALVEMLTIGAHSVRRAQLEPGENVLVVGAGPIGLSAAQFAHLAGARVAVLEISPWRREFCRKALGLTRLLEGGADTAAAFDGELPTVVFDATGNPGAMMGAIQHVAHGGKLVFISLVQADLTFRDPEMHKRELSLLRSRNATGADFAWAMRMVEDGRIALDPWITHRAAAAEVPEAFPGWLQPEQGVVKAVVEF